DMKERRVVIATNIAETSLTIRDVVYVVDSGLIKQSDWNPVTCRQELNTTFHSKDGCKQRWGRAGRVRKGFVHKLYSKEQFIKYFASHTPPEIKRSNAESMILGAMASGVNDIENFSMLEKPDKVELDRALNVVKKRGIVDKDFDFTEDGREVYRLSKALSSVLDKVEYNSTQRALDVASFLILADKYACLIEAVTAICMMPRMGNALYWQGDGLLQWDKNLNLVSKDYRIRMIDSFKAGCIDDLDFACKLYSLYEGCFFDQKLGEEYKNWFAKEYSLNLENFNRLNETRNNLIDVFSQGKKSSNLRQLDLNLVARVRVLAALSWLDRVVSIKKADNLLFESKEYDYFKGTISENCAGNWSNEKKAVIGILDQSENVIFIDGKRTKAAVANFLIKHIEPPASKNVIDIISAFRKYQTDEEVTNAFSNCISDLNIPINRKVLVDETKKPITISKSFQVSEQFANSTNADDLFIRIQHISTETENKSLYEIEIPKGVKATDDLILEQWVRKSKKVLAVLGVFSNYNPVYFSNIKINETVEATIKRPIFNIKGNGLREIIGFVISINGFQYALPVENIFIEFNYDSLMEIVGNKISLTNIALIPNSEQPLFSSIPSLEKERLEIFEKSEVIGTVVKKSYQTIFCQVQDEKLKSTHFVSIASSSINADKRFLEIDGEVTIEIIKPTNDVLVSVDCHDESFDLTDELKDTISDLLHEIKNDRNKYSTFVTSGIEINKTSIIATRKLQFEKIILLSFSFPLLSEAIKHLHKKSWELKGKINIIQKKVERDTKSREAKSNLILNISKNKGKLLRAKQKKSELAIKIAQPGNSYQWLAKANVWMQEFDDKIIRYTGWIKEGEDKLNNWKD
ncbi:helicase-related protein, partial [Acidocella sp.]|uniref:helicase-related protein n=1 Tax=Acidocella sp. TaxID=50710 RepID=UPI002627D74A